ncbi:hypothetical protein CPB84DRAFT_1849779 [Gymnopilus junonius]|uniref:DUF4419 domain-containing protein n=1 Tax=Gymnopilus junonius TaxID=109634 RepID=A0A9P5TK88_GYMJU|nr:hypothetical protein CPB84DRAFT_1849779 [Gymnopilus junonius]
MPVHFTISDHDANPVERHIEAITSNADLLARTWGRKANTIRCKELLQTSLVNPDFSAIHEKNNGFVDTVLNAYNQHHHLVLRPDDVWIAILGQFNFYVNAHAEELRQHFVAHEGQKDLLIRAVGTRYSVDFGLLANRMTELIDENIVDKTLKNWILPNFTTTTHNDTVIYLIIHLFSYFRYGLQLMCGIPSVTLEGEKEDWEKILARLDKLNEFGSEPTAWGALLRPICTRFVKAFDNQPDVDFWKKVCHVHPNFSGPSYLSGWITAFCVWDTAGKWQGPSLTTSPSNEPFHYLSGDIAQLVMDGVQYGIIKEHAVPSGVCEVPVNLDDNGTLFDCTMVSGHVASLVEGEKKDTVRPLPVWFMFIHEDEELNLKGRGR